MPKLSIVSTYYNRKLELYRTLKSIERSNLKDFEYVIVDDASSNEHRLEDLVEQFKFIKLKRIEPEQKTYYNPCMPYNLAISLAEGDIILLQSPECIHVGDSMQHAVDNVKYGNYIVYSCYSLGRSESSMLNHLDYNLDDVSFESQLSSLIRGFREISCDNGGRFNSWFTHPVYRKLTFNFLSAMTMKDMRELGGFDERFADGFAFDDTDFLERIIKKKMTIDIVRRPFCIHQFHPPITMAIPSFSEKEMKNRLLYEQLKEEPHYYVKNSFVKE